MASTPSVFRLLMSFMLPMGRYFEAGIMAREQEEACIPTVRQME